MWLLIILFLGPDLFIQQELYRYDTQAACQVERDRIGFLMADSYPQTHDFDVVCRFEASELNPRRT